MKIIYFVLSFFHMPHGKFLKILEEIFPNFTCVACNGEINSSENKYFCDKCIERLPFCVEENGIAFSPFEYEEPIRKMILSLKYNDNVFVGRAVAPFMAAVIIRRELVIDGLVPVPLHRSRFLERGYNQSELLCDEVAPYLNLPVFKDVLLRIKKTKIHKNMTRKQHFEDIFNAFKVQDPRAVMGKVILIVDDVLSTGITTNECRRVLLKNGAKDVWILTAAKA
ncbi:MAG: ComF family protein [Christensenellaceae bacterium]|jgi:competence protein ComFC|nr:ComF family protein [Christensenellaceae bacterium]